MSTIVNFIKGLFFESKSDIIGLARFNDKKQEIVSNKRQERKKDYTLTEMLRRTY